VVAKAALDRLLGFGPPFENEAAVIGGLLDQCRWMVMPMREFPWAPAQGAIALEVPDHAQGFDDLLQSVICGRTTKAVRYEREVLEQSGGGCHQALGAAVLETPFGRVVSIRSREGAVSRWELHGESSSFPRTTPDRVWPRHDEGDAAIRTPIAIAQPSGDAFRVARADALPPTWSLADNAVVWAAGSVTWRRLAARGVWVNGCADGLGDDDLPPVDRLAGRDLEWINLTHDRTARSDAIATYHVDVPLPDDLASRSHFFWTSGDVFLRALDRWPSIRGAWHASGPGRTRHTIAAAVGATERTGVWLDRDSWERDVCL
jgi:hydroxymethylbilane synthase